MAVKNNVEQNNSLKSYRYK